MALSCVESTSVTGSHDRGGFGGEAGYVATDGSELEELRVASCHSVSSYGSSASFGNNSSQLPIDSPSDSATSSSRAWRGLPSVRSYCSALITDNYVFVL